MLGLVLILVALPLAVFVRGAAGTRSPAEQQVPLARRIHPRAMRSSRLLPRVALPSPRACRLLFVVAAPPFVLTAITFHSVSVLAERGLSFEEAGFALGMLGIASVTGTVAGGWLSDRTRTRTLLSALTALLLEPPTSWVRCSSERSWVSVSVRSMPLLLGFGSESSERLRT